MTQDFSADGYGSITINIPDGSKVSIQSATTTHPLAGAVEQIAIDDTGITIDSLAGYGAGVAGVDNTGKLSWATGGGPPGGAAGGDLGGTYPNPSVVNAHGASIPSGSSLTTGNVLQVSGSSALTYAPISLNAGSNYVTGSLPTANQVSQTMGGDISGTTASATLIAIRGKSISSAMSTIGAAQDGYALTWDNTDGYWTAEPQPAKVQQVNFTASGSWTCPPNVFLIQADGYGGGGGGAGGAGGDSSSSTQQGSGGGGGGGSLRRQLMIPVIPGTSYTITIGAGGLGGTGGAAVGSGTNGSDGGSTLFKSGATTLATFAGGGKGYSATANLAATAQYLVAGGTNCAGSGGSSTQQNVANISNGGFVLDPSYGGWSGTTSGQFWINGGAPPTAGSGSYDGFSGGAAGTSGTPTGSGPYGGSGGGGGGAGPGGNGSAGGNGGNGGSGANPGVGKRSDGTTGTAALTSPNTNTGAGGGAGGAGGTSSASTGSVGGGGTAGDNGHLSFIYFT